METKGQIYSKIKTTLNRIPKKTQAIVLVSGVLILSAVGFGMKVQADQETAIAQHLIETQGFEVYYNGELFAKVRNDVDIQMVIEEKSMFLEKAEGIAMIPDGNLHMNQQTLKMKKNRVR